MKEELSTVYEFHDHIQPLLVLEGIFKSHDEGMIEFLENLTLNYFKQRIDVKYEFVLTSDASDLISLDQELLRNRLHRVYLLSDVMSHKVDLAICAPTDRFQDREIALLHS